MRLQTNDFASGRVGQLARCSRESKRLPEECHGSDLLSFSSKPVLRDLGGGQIRLDSGHDELAAPQPALVTRTEHRQLIVAFRDQALRRIGYPAAWLRNEQLGQVPEIPLLGRSGFRAQTTKQR